MGVMLGIVDHIEDGAIAVIKIRGGGELVIPVSNLPLKVFAGACLNIAMALNKKEEAKQHAKIKKLQAHLLKRKW